MSSSGTVKASGRTTSSAGTPKASGWAASSTGTPNTCCTAAKPFDTSRECGPPPVADDTNHTVPCREVTLEPPGKRTTPPTPMNPLAAGEFMKIRLRSYSATLQVRRRMLDHANEVAQDRLATRLEEHGLQIPSADLHVSRPAVDRGAGVDVEKQRVFSESLRRSGMPLPDFFRLLRGESESDPRPNKALEIPSHSPGWSSYKYREAWEDVVLHGVIPTWKNDFHTPRIPPSNHTSASVAMQSILRSIRKGQDRNQYLVLDLDLLNNLPGVTCSPFGATPKGSASLSEDARMIHDLSYPVGHSVNDNTIDDGSVTIQYDGPHALARRVLEVESKSPGHTKLLSGDVNGAFRNVPIHADHVGRFAGVIRELDILVIDLACPFGWTLSPVKYWLAGSAIAHLYSTAKPNWPAQPAHAAQPFDAKTWCDDHNAIEADIGTRLFEADLALREAMIVVLGPDAINEDKFTTWQTTGKALGLHWNIPSSYVAMPPEKIAKALLRVENMLSRKHTSKSDLEKLLGSLRHVVTCVRSAAPFFQRLSSLCRSIRRFCRAPISNGARDDLRWFRLILQTANLNWIPLQRFAHSQPPDINVFMDASDIGLCALCPSRKEYIQVAFDAEERDQIDIFHQEGEGDYGINLRELMSAVFACAVWGPHWTSSDSFFQMHIRLWIDNQSAVSWNNKRASRNVTAQLLLRLLGLVEIRYNFYATAAHIPGVENIMADAGSRVWQSTSKAEEFANLSCGWSQVPVPTNYRKLSRLWELCCVQGH